jgi:hypothetical protein
LVQAVEQQVPPTQKAGEQSAELVQVPPGVRMNTAFGLTLLVTSTVHMLPETVVHPDHIAKALFWAGEATSVTSVP